MNINEQTQALSDALHDGLDEIDNVIFAASERLQMALRVRIESGMMGADGQRTIKRMTQQIKDLSEIRSKHILVHGCAQKDAEKADLPWQCPEASLGGNVVHLQSVEG